MWKCFAGEDEEEGRYVKVGLETLRLNVLKRTPVVPLYCLSGGVCGEGRGKRRRSMKRKEGDDECTLGQYNTIDVARDTCDIHGIF